MGVNWSRKMLRDWVFMVDSRQAESTKIGTTETEITVRAYTLNEAWTKLAAKLPLNTMCVKFDRIKYL